MEKILFTIVGMAGVFGFIYILLALVSLVELFINL